MLVQNYLTGLCGGDVTPSVIDDIVADIGGRSEVGDPVWIGVDAREETIQ
jgi:hypothetical protein